MKCCEKLCNFAQTHVHLVSWMAALLYPLFCFALLLFLHSTFWKDAWKSGMCLGTLVVALWPYISLYYVVICSIAHVLYVLWHFAIKYFNKEVHVSSSSTWNHGKSFFPPVVSKLASRIVLFYWYWYRLLNFWYRDTPTLYLSLYKDLLTVS